MASLDEWRTFADLVINAAEMKFDGIMARGGNLNQAKDAARAELSRQIDLYEKGYGKAPAIFWDKMDAATTAITERTSSYI